MAATTLAYVCCLSWHFWQPHELAMNKVSTCRWPTSCSFQRLANSYQMRLPRLTPDRSTSWEDWLVADISYILKMYQLAGVGKKSQLCTYICTSPHAEVRFRLAAENYNRDARYKLPITDRSLPARFGRQQHSGVWVYALGVWRWRYTASRCPVVAHTSPQVGLNLTNQVNTKISSVFK